MIIINQDSITPLYQQIYEQIKEKIISGEYQKGYRLTSTRELAKELCVGRNTVESAYTQLCLEGYIESKARSGYVTLNISNESLVSDNNLDVLESEFSTQQPKTIGEPVNHPVQEKIYDFEYGDMDPSLFPYSKWRRISAEVLRSSDSKNINYYNEFKGEHDLRVQIMKYIHESRGVTCTPEQIILCGGIRYALELICKMFPERKRIVAFEEPGFDGCRNVFENNGYQIKPIPITKTGVDLDIIKKSSAHIAFITPSHQFPTGVVMPIQHRVNLLQWAQQNNSVIIEDDYDSEFRYHSRPIPSLQSIDRHGRVIYLGTFAKSLAPGLRMSYMILPKWLLPLYQKLFNRYPSTVPWLEQRIVATFMERGDWQRHLRKVCLKNKKKYNVLIQVIKNKFGNNVIIHAHDAGLHILLEFKNGEQYCWLEDRARQYGVKIYSTHDHWYQKECCPNNFVLLGFSSLTEPEIAEGIHLLKKAWF